jgi:hypothetical protein
MALQNRRPRVAAAPIFGGDMGHTKLDDILVIFLDGYRLQYRSRVHVASPT